MRTAVKLKEKNMFNRIIINTGSRISVSKHERDVQMLIKLTKAIL